MQPVLLGRWATRHGADWSRVPRILFWPGLRLRLQLQLHLDARAVRKNEGRVVTGVLGSCAIWTAWVAERQRVGFWCLSVGVSLSWEGGRELPGTEEKRGGGGGCSTVCGRYGKQCRRLPALLLFLRILLRQQLKDCVSLF